MSIQTILDPQKPYLIQLVTDALLVNEVIEAQKRLYLDPAHNPQMPVLWDTTDVDVQSGFTEIFKMVEQSTDFWSNMAGGRTAILVHSANSSGNSSANNTATARLYKN